MDPLSVTLAVITLATALKDLVEVAQNIRDAFAKAPQNYKNALKLATGILRISKDMHKLYREKKEIFDMAPDLKKSLHELKEEMLLVRNECARLIPPVAERKRDKFRIAFYSFWNRNKVEELVSELRNHIDSCYKQFSLLSGIRIEATVNQIAHVLNTALEVQSYSEDKYSLNMHSLSNNRLFQFDQSYSTPMTHIHDTIPIHDLSNAYLRRELGKIEVSLGRLASIRWSQNPSTPFQILPLNKTWNLGEFPISRADLHQNMVIRAFKLQSLLLKPHLLDVSILSINLSHMDAELAESGMYKDALSVRTWAVDLWRHITSVSPSDNAWTNLADDLMGLSICYADSGDKDQAYAKSQESMNIIHGKLYNVASSPLLQELVARNLSIQADILAGDKAIELACKAVATMKGALELQHIYIDNNSKLVLPRVEDSKENPIIAPVDDDKVTLPLRVSDDSLYTYSIILLKYSTLQEHRGYIADAHSTKRCALAMLKYLALEYPESKRILQLTASTLHDLCNSDYHGLNSLSDDLASAEECANIYRKLAKKNFSLYIVPLSTALQSYRQILLHASRPRDSDKIFKEMTSLMELTSEECLDLKLPSEEEGDYFYSMTLLHHSEHRYSEAIYAVQNAVTQYSALEFMYPDQSPYKHIKALTTLCELLHNSNQHQSAIIEGFKALQVIDNTRDLFKSSSIANQHILLIDHILNAVEASLEPSSTSKADTLIARFQKLFVPPVNWTVASDAPAIYMAILGENRTVDEALNYAQEFLTKWENTWSYSRPSNIVYIYLSCLKARIEILKNSYRTEEALKHSADIVAIAKQCFHHHKILHFFYNFVTMDHIRLLCDAGQHADGLALSELVVADARKAAPHSNSMNYLVRALDSRTCCQLYSLQPEAAITSTTKALSLCRKELVTGIEQDIDSIAIMLGLLYDTLLNLAISLSDIGDMDQALIHLKEAEKVLVEGEIIESKKPGSYVYSHQVVSLRTSLTLFAKGNHVEAASLIEEVIVRGRKLNKRNRHGVITLLTALQFSGILYCTLGRHVDGILAVNEAAAIKEDLVNSPGLARLVEVEQNINAKQGTWKHVQDAKDKLRCHHQDLE